MSRARGAAWRHTFGRRPGLCKCGDWACCCSSAGLGAIGVAALMEPNLRSSTDCHVPASGPYEHKRGNLHRHAHLPTGTAAGTDRTPQ